MNFTGGVLIVVNGTGQGQVATIASYPLLKVNEKERKKVKRNEMKKKRKRKRMGIDCGKRQRQIFCFEIWIASPS